MAQDLVKDWLEKKGKIQNYPQGYGLENSKNNYISKKKKKINFEYVQQRVTYCSISS